jgi:hypothetical protein
MPATLPDGSTYTPILVLDQTTSVGQTTSPDASTSSLVVVTAGGGVRVLQTHLVNYGGSYDGITATADRVFWMHTVSDADGQAVSSVWSADLLTGQPTMLTTDVGQPLFYDSQYDMQAVKGRLYWTSARDGHPDQTELRSIELTGGPVHVQTLRGFWQMTAWPWLVTAPTAPGAATQLSNLDTGVTTTANVPTNNDLTCGHIWCRMITGSAEATRTDLIRPDGSDRRRIGDANTTPMSSDVALLDRFEAVLTTATPGAPMTVSRLDLYDIADGKPVLLDAAATGASARGNFVWWSTGDNETLAWHGLDLRTLR